jgi:hypothetical protein
MTEVLFGLSLFPYLVFLWYISKNSQFPPLARWGFYGTLLFVLVSAPAGIYAQQHYAKSLSNVDWLHGSAEAFLSFANILLVLGFKSAYDQAQKTSQSAR